MILQNGKHKIMEYHHTRYDAIKSLINWSEIFAI